MKLELLVFLITGFFVANTYYDGKLIKVIKGWKKYYQMAFFGFAGICIYIFIKKNPANSKDLFSHANNFVKYMPIDRDTSSMITPFLDMTSSTFNNDNNTQNNMNGGTFGSGMGDGMHGYTPQQKRMMNSGGKSTKRCVSETKKKYVAAQQGWTCNHCNIQLPAWYEIDHKVRLEYGGTNHIDNLVALCRNCHGKKTALENL